MYRVKSSLFYFLTFSVQDEQKGQSRMILTAIILIGILFPALKFLIGNKSDLENLIPSESVDNFSAAFECEYTYLFSAKTGRYFSGWHICLSCFWILVWFSFTPIISFIDWGSEHVCSAQNVYTHKTTKYRVFWKHRRIKLPYFNQC